VTRARRGTVVFVGSARPDRATCDRQEQASACARPGRLERGHARAYRGGGPGSSLVGALGRPYDAPMLTDQERGAITRLWARKLDQDARDLPKAERHRNLEPDSAEFILALAAGLRAKRLCEIGGSSGVSTIALAAAARATGGKLVSIEIEPRRQAESRATLEGLGLAPHVELVLGDAAEVLGRIAALELVLIDCEKEDYIRFFEMLDLAPSAVVVADNILSHGLTEYTAHVRARRGAESVTFAIGKGLEVTRLP